MVPQLTILVIAIIGAFVDGVSGFFVWGICGFVGVLIFSWLLNMFSGGLLPREVRDETATDFIAQFPELIKRAYPGQSPYEAKQKVALLLDRMMKKIIFNNPSPHFDFSESHRMFFESAIEVAEEQSNKDLKELAGELISFVRTHRLWYGAA